VSGASSACLRLGVSTIQAPALARRVGKAKRAHIAAPSRVGTPHRFETRRKRFTVMRLCPPYAAG
jgi:hypothetical protein